MIAISMWLINNIGASGSREVLLLVHELIPGNFPKPKIYSYELKTVTYEYFG